MEVEEGPLISEFLAEQEPQTSELPEQLEILELLEGEASPLSGPPVVPSSDPELEPKPALHALPTQQMQRQNETVQSFCSKLEAR